MKRRWIAGLQVVILLLLSSACTNPTNLSLLSDPSQVAASAPLLYLQGDSLYCLTSGKSAVKIEKGLSVEETDPNGIPALIPSVKGIFRISPDKKQLAYVTEPQDEYADLHVASTERQNTQVISEVCLGFRSTPMHIDNPFLFAPDGHLYYLKADKDAVSIDLYRYIDGQNELVVQNAVNFFIEESGQYLFYTSAIEYSQEEKEQLAGHNESTEFINLYSTKFQMDKYRLIRMELKTGKTLILSETASDMFYPTKDYIDFSQDYNVTTGKSVQKRYSNGQVIDSPQTTFKLTDKQKYCLQIDDNTIIYRDQDENGYFLWLRGQTPQRIEDYEYNHVHIQDPDKAKEMPYMTDQHELSFVSSLDGTIYYWDQNQKNNDETENLFSFKIDDGKIVDKKSVASQVLDCQTLAPKMNGVLCTKKKDAAIGSNDDYETVYHVNGKTVLLGDNISVHVKNYLDGGLFFTRTVDAKRGSRDLYRLDGDTVQKIKSDITSFCIANGQVYTAVFKDKAWDIYSDGQLVAQNVHGVVDVLTGTYY